LAIHPSRLLENDPSGPAPRILKWLYLVGAVVVPAIASLYAMHDIGGTIGAVARGTSLLLVLPIFVVYGGLFAFRYFPKTALSGWLWMLPLFQVLGSTLLFSSKRDWGEVYLLRSVAPFYGLAILLSIGLLVVVAQHVRLGLGGPLEVLFAVTLGLAGLGVVGLSVAGALHEWPHAIGNDGWTSLGLSVGLFVSVHLPRMRELYAEGAL